MADLGLLNFEIGGDLTKYNQAMEQAKQQAQQLQTLLTSPAQNVKINLDISQAKQQAEEVSKSFRTIQMPIFNSGGFTSSIENMRVQLSQLTQRYNLLSEAERKAEGGQKLALNIQNLKSNINDATSNLSPNIEKANSSLGKHYSLT